MKKFIIKSVTKISKIILFASLIYSLTLLYFYYNGIYIGETKGTSMLPNIPYQSISINKNISSDDINNLKVGDIVVYNSADGGKNICHRIINISNQDNNYIFTVKGDFNQTSDKPVTQDRIISKVLIDLPYTFHFLLNYKFKILVILYEALSGIWLQIKAYKEFKNKTLNKDNKVITTC